MKRKLFFLLCALLTMIGVQAQPLASTPEVGQVYYLYNPTTKLFMTTNVDLSFVRPSGSAWRLEAAAGHDGWITLRLKDNETDGCGYFWGKWWANNPAQNSNDYAVEREYQLVNTSGSNYKLKSYAWGETEAYIYINKGNEGDRSYRLACNSQDQGGLDEGYMTWQFISEEDYATYMSMDYTSRISNNDFLSGVANWTLEGAGNKQAHGNTAIEYWNAKAAEGNFDYYQNVVVPAGKYVLRAAMYNSTNGEGGASFSAPGQCGVYGTSNNVTKNANVSVDGTAYNIYTTEELLVPDGNLRLGFKNSATMTARWFGADWIQLTCIEYCLSAVAEALPANGEMTAGKWYKYSVMFDGNYSITATTSANIIQTTDGTQTEGSATGEAVVTGDLVPLTAGTTIYYKSSSDNTLVVAAASYSYEVGDATISVPNGSYISALSTINFTFADAQTNDPDASFALLNGSAKAVLTKGGENVAEGTLSLSGKVLTATFSDVELAPSSTYDIAIAAGVVGYEGEETNAAINTSFRTGIIADGVYYFKKKGEYKYLTRGGNYGTENVTDKFGISFEATVQSDGTYYLRNVDQSLVENTNKYLNEQYTDQGAYKWTIESAEGGYVLKKSSGQYVTTAEEGTWHYNYMTNAADKASAIVWTLLSKSQYADALTARKNAEAAAIATAAGRSETTEAALISALASDFGETDKTESLTNASLASNADGWTAVSYNAQRRNQDGEGNDVIRFNGGAEVWNYIGGAKQTVSSLPEGIYKVTVKSVWRLADSNGANRAGDEANVTAWMYANDNYTQLKSWYDYPVANNAALHESTDDTYVNTLYVYVEEGEDLTIGVASPSWSGVPWMPFYDFTLTYYEAKATPAQKTDLANAIIAAEAKTLGFEDGEYAPYNNVDALSKLAAAKAIDPDNASGEAVVNATTALTGATWTANVGEVNAISWEDYTSGDIAGDNYIHPRGWTNTGYNTRIYSEAAGNKDSNNGISAVHNLAMMMKYNTTYGETEGYTMPLKAATVYKINFKYCGWGNTPTTNIVLTDPEDNDITVTPTSFRPTTSDGNANASDWYDYTGYFVSTTAGDYVFAFNKVESGQQQIGIGDLELKKAPASYTANLKVSNGKLGTFIAPFDITLPANVKAYSATSDETTVTLTKIAEGGEELAAGTPVIIYGDGDGVDETFYGVPTVTENRTVGALTGILDDSNKAISSGNYVLQTQDDVQAFYKLNASATGKLNRCYVTAGVSGNARLVISIDDDPTAINAIEAADAETEGLKDGKYLIENKIVLVKNGVKYSANGQILK